MFHYQTFDIIIHLNFVCSTVHSVCVTSLVSFSSSLPLPSSRFSSQGSRWTLQAVLMNGELGTVAVKPDQMQALNPILILVFIPIFEFGVYPLAAKCRLLKRYAAVFTV